jgi:RND family efflux transporter MFP subunit
MNQKVQDILNLIKKGRQKLLEFAIAFPHKHRQAFISLLIFTGVALITIVTILLKRPVAREDIISLAPLVEVEQLQKQDIKIIVTGYGTAEAKTKVEIAPQVSGTVVSINPQFTAGGFISAGKEIFRIDPRDYALVVEQAEAGVADAQVKLDLEEAEAAVALEEWEQLHPGTKPDSPLVLRQPQIRQAEAAIKSANAALAAAKLSLERTSVTLPVDVRIVSESIDLGQFVTTGQRIANAYGIEAIEIEVPLEDKELAWLDIPDQRNSQSVKGSPVVVKAEFAGTQQRWKGYISRTTGQVDQRSRLIYVVVEVPEPSNPEKGQAILLPGTFIEVEIGGKVIKDVFAIPRNAVHNRNEIWVVNDNKLHTKKINIFRSDKDFAYTTDEIADAETIIVSSLDVVIDGMKVRVKE